MFSYWLRDLLAPRYLQLTGWSALKFDLYELWIGVSWHHRMYGDMHDFGFQIGLVPSITLCFFYQWPSPRESD